MPFIVSPYVFSLTCHGRHLQNDGGINVDVIGSEELFDEETSACHPVDFQKKKIGGSAETSSGKEVTVIQICHLNLKFVNS